MANKTQVTFTVGYRSPTYEMGVGIRPGRLSHPAGLKLAARSRRRTTDDAAGGASRVRGHEVVWEAQGPGVEIKK